MNPSAGQTLAIFHGTGAYLQGHFLLTSGLHSPEYLQCALVLQHPELAERLGRELAAGLRSIEPAAKIGLVVAPAMGGLIIGHEVARALGAKFLFTERDASTRAMALRRGFQIDPGEDVMVVEDVITTGGSLREVIGMVHTAGSRVVAAGSIIDRSGGCVELGVPHVALATLSVTSYPAGDCPMCRQQMPVVKPGSRPA